MKPTVVYTTADEIVFMHGLYQRNRPVFLKYSRQVINNGRRWDGPGMDIDVALLKRRLHDLLAEHDRETDPVIPALRIPKPN